jgi:hypothetical protein
MLYSGQSILGKRRFQNPKPDPVFPFKVIAQANSEVKKSIFFLFLAIDNKFL